jgi:hypothetical protein
MALKRLRTSEMVALTATWVDPAHPDRQAMARVAALAALLPEVDGAHQGLHRTHAIGPSAVRRKQIQAEQKVLDLEHDNVLRGISSHLWSAIYFTRDPEARNELERLLALLLPDGLLSVNKSYREQAGQAELAASRLTEADRALLQSLLLHDGRTLLDAVNQWLSLSAQLGALDRERVGIPPDDGPTPADAMAARNRWIRTVQAVQLIARLVAEQDPAIREILDRMEEAGRTADRRSAGRTSEDALPGPGDAPPGPGDARPDPLVDTP